MTEMIELVAEAIRMRAIERRNPVNPIVALDLARAAIAAMPGWEPIETAPRDGTRCDVWAVYTDAYGSSAQRYTNARFDEKKASWVDGGNNLLDWSELDEKDGMKPRGRKTTHWMPLPAPPDAALGEVQP